MLIRSWSAAAIIGLLVGAQQSCGRIQDASLEHDERGIVLVAEPFGFTTSGHVKIEVDGFEVWTGAQAAEPLDLSAIGFFLASSQTEMELQGALLRGVCALDAAHVAHLLLFSQVADAAREGLPSSVSIDMKNLVPGFRPGLYSLYYANCQRPSLISAHVRTSMFNVKGGAQDYLSEGEDKLPPLYMAFALAFLAASCTWCAVLWRGRGAATRIHRLMMLLVSLKTLTLGSQAGMFLFIRDTGHPDGWQFAFYIFTFFRSLLFFVVVVLIGTGWVYARALLSSRERLLLGVLVPLQVLGEVALILTDSLTPAARAWFTWRDVLLVADIVCGCLVLLPLVWQIKAAQQGAAADGKEQQNLAVLRGLRHLYMLVVAFIYCTRLLTFLLQSTLPYPWAWASTALQESVTLAFYCTVAYQFRPAAEYFHLPSDEPAGPPSPRPKREQP